MVPTSPRPPPGPRRRPARPARNLKPRGPVPRAGSPVKIEPFEMERMQSTWENVVEINLSESGVEPIPPRGLLPVERDPRAPGDDRVDVRGRGPGPRPRDERLLRGELPRGVAPRRERGRGRPHAPELHQALGARPRLRGGGQD